MKKVGNFCFSECLTLIIYGIVMFLFTVGLWFVEKNFLDCIIFILTSILAYFIVTLFINRYCVNVHPYILFFANIGVLITVKAVAYNQVLLMDKSLSKTLLYLASLTVLHHFTINLTC